MKKYLLLYIIKIFKLQKVSIKNILMIYNLYLFIYSIIAILNLMYLKQNKKRNITLFVGNSFHGYHILPNESITCSYYEIKYKCTFTHNNKIVYDASIYNGNRKFPQIPNTSYNIIMTIEKLSQVRFMKQIGDGKSRYYQLAVDYRLFYNRWHIPCPYIKNISNLVYLAQTNYINNMAFFNRRNEIVYIQRKHYNNRQYMVKELMKHYSVDSYGKDLNNKNWPLNISKSNKINILKEYKFCLAIENSIVLWKKGEKYVSDLINNDYVTEKLFDCFSAGSIPIYFGPQNINLFLPHNDAIINLRDFDNIKNLTDYLNKIKNNYTLLYKHLRWHNHYSSDWYKRFSKLYKFSYCKICNSIKKYS